MFNQIRKTEISINASASINPHEDTSSSKHLHLDSDYYSLAMYAFYKSDSYQEDDMEDYIIRTRNTAIFTKISLIFFI